MTTARPSVLVAEDDPHMAEQMRWALKADYHVRLASDRVQAIQALQRKGPDVLLLDLCLPPDNTPEEGFRILKAARDRGRDTVILVMSALEEREAALRAVAEGAYDFFPKPVDLDVLRIVIGRALERQALERENKRLRERLSERYQVEGLLGVSPPMLRVLEAIRRVKDSSVTVILVGESGTGKELAARAVHFSGERREGPFVPVHCAALPESLLEAELFGHERGAFTGAAAQRVGRFEAADGGSLFLDEVGCLTPSTQIKLLRVLEDRTVERLGSNVRRAVDIRLIVATNEDLKEKVKRGEFREDLFYRINVFPIRLPPLRERAEDVPLLAEHFLRRAAEGRGTSTKALSPDARQALMARPWPGNVRELANLMETLALVVDRDTIRAADLPAPAERMAGLPTLDRAREIGLKAAVDEFERSILVEAIARAGGVKGRAAAALGLDPSQMKYLVKKHGL